MIRLALVGIDEATTSALAPRMRGVDVRFAQSLDQLVIDDGGCTGVLIHGTCSSATVDDALPHITTILSSKKSVLLTQLGTLSNDVVEQLAECARRNGVQFGLINPDRFLPSRQVIKQQFESGKLGTIGLLRIHRWWGRDDCHGHSHTQGIPASFFNDLDTAVWFLGQVPNLVYATCAKSNNTPSSPYDALSIDSCHVHLGFADGAMSLLSFESCLSSEVGYQSLSVIGSAGAAYADDHQNTQLAFRAGETRAIVASERIRQLANLVQFFADHLLAARDCSNQLSARKDVAVVGDAIQKSLETRQAVAVENHGANVLA